MSFVSIDFVRIVVVDCLDIRLRHAYIECSTVTNHRRYTKL